MMPNGKRIEKKLPNANRKHDLRQVWNAIMYLLKIGCQWRLLPRNKTSNSSR